MARSHTTLLGEASGALEGTRLLLRGRPEAIACFDFSQRGLAGSFIAPVLACVAIVVFFGMAAGPARPFPSPAGQVFICGALMTLRLGALRLVLSQLGALDAFRPYMVASNWASAIGAVGLLVATVIVTVGLALLLGPSSAQIIVGLILMLWAAAAIALLVIEINIYRLIARLGPAEIALALLAQIGVLTAGALAMGYLPLA